MRVLPAFLVLALFSAAGAQAGTIQPGTIPGFRSPSGNISCALLAKPATLFCSIAQSSYAPRLQARCMRPDGSGVDWHGFELGAARKGAVTCSGGALVMGKLVYTTVPYGSAWRRGPFRCLSARTGIRCRSTAGHGVFVSRASWRVW
jgi:hypothetical protein